MSEQIQTRYSTKNYILNALPDEDYARLHPHLEEVSLALGQIIYRAEERVRHIYFPNNVVVSVIANTPDGQSAEVGVIGWEGMTGINVLMGVDSTSHESIIQIADGALRISAGKSEKSSNAAARCKICCSIICTR